MALMAVAHNNTAGFYYRKQGLAAVALRVPEVHCLVERVVKALVLLL